MQATQQDDPHFQIGDEVTPEALTVHAWIPLMERWKTFIVREYEELMKQALNAQNPNQTHLLNFMQAVRETAEFAHNTAKLQPMEKLRPWQSASVTIMGALAEMVQALRNSDFFEYAFPPSSRATSLLQEPPPTEVMRILETIFVQSPSIWDNMLDPYYREGEDATLDQQDASTAYTLLLVTRSGLDMHMHDMLTKVAAVTASQTSLLSKVDELITPAVAQIACQRVSIPLMRCFVLFLKCVLAHIKGTAVEKAVCGNIYTKLSEMHLNIFKGVENASIRVAPLLLKCASSLHDFKVEEGGVNVHVDTWFATDVLKLRDTMLVMYGALPSVSPSSLHISPSS